MDDLVTNQEHEEEVSHGLFIFLGVMFSSLFLSHMVKRCNIEMFHVPEIATLIGFFSGLIVHLGLNASSVLEQVLMMNDDVFFLLLLPPIIFDSGLSIRGEQGKSFFSNCGTILWFALFSTTLSVLFVGFGLIIAAFNGSISPISFREAFAFASLISSTDPIAVLAVLKDLGASSHLTSIIGGESLLNDAVAIILYKSVTATEYRVSSKMLNKSTSQGRKLSKIGNFASSLSFNEERTILEIIPNETIESASDIQPQTYAPPSSSSHPTEIFVPIGFTKRSHDPVSELLLLLVEFILVFCGSIACGACVGLLGSYLLKKMSLRSDIHENRLLEATLLFLFPWIAYVAAESVGSSGVVAVLSCAVCLTTYGVPNLSSGGRIAVRGTFSILGFIAETAVFCFLGLAFSSFDLEWSSFIGFICISFGVVMCARFASVRFTCLIVNKIRKSILTPSEEFMISFGGLRGAVAFALALRARRDFTVVNEGGRGKRIGDSILSATLILAGVSTILLGPIMKPVGLLLKINSKDEDKVPKHSEEEEEEGLSRTGSDDGETATLNSQHHQTIGLLVEEEDDGDEEQVGCFKKGLLFLHEKVFTPLLIKNGDEDPIEISPRNLPNQEMNLDRETVLHMVRRDTDMRDLHVTAVSPDLRGEWRRNRKPGDKTQFSNHEEGNEHRQHTISASKQVSTPNRLLLADSSSPLRDSNNEQRLYEERNWGEGRSDAYRTTLLRDGSR